MIPQERRISARRAFRHLAYLSLPSDNGGIVLDASEGGLRFHAIGPIQTAGPIEFRFAIDSATRITATGEIAWKDSTGKTGGLRFTELPDEARQQLRLWVDRSNTPASPRSAIESVLDIINLPGSGQQTANATPSAVAWQAGELGLLAASTVTSAALTIIERLEAAVPAAVAAVASPESPAPGAMIAPVESDQTPVTAVASVATDPIAADEAVLVAVAPCPTPPPATPASIGESAVVIGTPPAPRPQNPSYSSNALAARAREAISTSKSKHSSSPIVASELPPRYQSAAPMFGALDTQFSMFGLNRKPAGKPSGSFTRPPVPIQNPVGAVILTIALAFIVSVGAFTCLFQTRAGDALVHWGQAIWGISNPQEISEVPSATVAAPDASSSSRSR